MPVILALGLVSGGISLAYEVLWTRELLNLLGSTTRASAVMLAAFMAGLAIGAWIAGWWSDRLARPLWLYVAAEGLLAVIALAFPELLRWFAGLEVGSSSTGAMTDPAYLSLAVIVALVVVPTILMGVALPALAAAMQGHGAAHHRYVAWLYGLSAFGGAAAALIVGFGALPAYGLAACESATVVAGVLAATAAAAVAVGYPTAAAAPVEARERPIVPPVAVSQNAIKAALLLSGIAALGCEVLWTRILVLVVGSSTYAFTLMLGLYLVGLALGGLWIGHYLGRLRAPLLALQHLQIGVAAATLIGVALFGTLPGLALSGFASLGTSPASIAAVNGAIAALVVVPPTIFIGASLPLAVRLLERRVPRRGRELGTALVWVVAGNVAGVLLTAFGIIPWVGLQTGVIVLAGLNLTAACVLWMAGTQRLAARHLAVPGAALVAVLIAPIIPSWDAAVMTSGVFRQAPIYLALVGSPERLYRAFSAYRTLFYREGSEAVVAVFDRPTLQGPPHRVLTIDGKVDASTGADMATQVLSGHLPFMFRPEAKHVLVIGLASGVTVGALGRHALDQIDVVEIEPAVVEASRLFDEASGAPLQDPRVRLIIEDGRHYLRRVATRYDVIVSEPSNPWLSMSARLFTREFFELALDRLGPRGLLIQWVPLYGLSTPQFETLLRTLADVFASISLFHVAEGDLLVVASMAPVSVAPTAVDLLFEGVWRTDLQSAGVREPADLLARLVADDDGLRAVLGPGPLNTDDNGLLEFGSPWYLLEDTRPQNLAVINRASAASRFVDRIVDSWLPRKDGRQLLEAVASRHLANGRVQLVRGLAASMRVRGSVSDADLLMGDAAAAEGAWAEAIRFWDRQETPRFLLRRARLAFRRGELAEATRLLDRTSNNQRSGEDEVMYAVALAGTGRPRDALNILANVPSAPNSVAGILSPFIKVTLLAEQGQAERAAIERRKLDVALNELRRCLEVDGCHDINDALLVWSKAAPAGTLFEAWDDLRRTHYARVMRPLPLYLRGVSQLWLGEHELARATFRTYLKLLPEPDSRSRVHDLLASTE